MDCTQAVMTLLLLAPCDSGGSDSIDLAIANSLASPDRIEADRASDPLRRPDQVLAFFGIKPGMDVLDLFSGAGYYTEILSRTVGESGSVLAHNNNAYINYIGDPIKERYAGGRLANVERVTAEADELELPDSRFDAALVMLTWHDFYYVDEANGWPPIDEQLMVKKLCAALKPGAVLGITDHVGQEGSDPAATAQQLHRVDPARIRADMEGSCFEYEGEIKVLRNPDDDLSKPMFDPAVRGRTDRVVYRFRRS